MAYNKYHAVKVHSPDGIFDSKHEFYIWEELKLKQRAGMIRDLQRQVRFDLVPSQKGKIRNERRVSYVADFTYTDRSGAYHVLDAKGVKTPEYVIKRKLMLHVKGIEIEEV